jgi:glycosyl transferase family 25
MHTYIITTKDHSCKDLKAIKERLERLGFQVSLIEGVKGAELTASEYFRHIQFWRSHTGRLMAPGELGCALSHQKALRLAAQHGTGFQLFLEDDFIASDSALEWIHETSAQLPPQTILHLGGLEGSPERLYRYIRARNVPEMPNIAVLESSDIVFLKRTVAYAIDAATANIMADLIEKTPYVIDDFSYPYDAGAFKQVWFRWIVSHPRDAHTSTIELERKRLGITRKSASWKVRSWTDLSRKRRLQWQLLWRRLTTKRNRFIKMSQSGNQLAG